MLGDGSTVQMYRLDFLAKSEQVQGLVGEEHIFQLCVRSENIPVPAEVEKGLGGLTLLEPGRAPESHAALDGTRFGRQHAGPGFPRSRGSGKVKSPRSQFCRGVQRQISPQELRSDFGGDR